MPSLALARITLNHTRKLAEGEETKGRTAAPGLAERPSHTKRGDGA
jgi:hypothetical protein